MRQFGEGVLRSREGRSWMEGGRSWKDGKGRDEVRNLRWRSVLFSRALGAKGRETQVSMNLFT